MQVMDAITESLGVGKYTSWAEEKKIEWLTEELKSRRPLIGNRKQVCVCVCACVVREREGERERVRVRVRERERE